MKWLMTMRGLSNHLTNDIIMKPYKDMGEVGRLFTSQHWAKDEIKASGLLDAMIPNEMFHKVKNTTNVKEVWKKLKEEFEGKLRSVLVDLGRKFQTTCYSENDAHLHKKLLALERSVNDNKYIAVLIGSLPPCYNGPIDFLTSSYDVNYVNITPTAITWAAI
jgi:hypothetical protein